MVFQIIYNVVLFKMFKNYILSLCVNIFEAKPLNVSSKFTHLVFETNDISIS
jgi:hypothetical protein